MKNKNRQKIRLWAVIFWLAVWQIASMLLNQEIFLVSPVRVVIRIGELAVTGEFWFSVLRSLIRIVLGYVLGVFCGTLLAALSSRFARVRELLAPVMLVMRTVPVASFIILVLILFSSRPLATLIAFLIVMPIVYGNVCTGIGQTDEKMLEMASVFRVPAGRRSRYIYLPALYPYLETACRTAVGMAWKAGTAAEVIGMPGGSIGEKLQRAKVYLETPDLLAWTVVIVLLSVACEKLFMYLLGRAYRSLSRVPRKNQEIPRSVWTTPGADKSPIGETAVSASVSKARGDISCDISIESVSKSFDGRKVLDDLTLTFPAGSASAVMAPSGSGKTTLLRIIAGLETPDKGTVSVPKDAKIAFVFQEDRLLEHLDIYENIRLVSPFVSDDEINGSLSEVSMTDSGSTPVSTFSGGMKRRAAVLRALHSDHDILLLDEPFKGMDILTKNKTASLVKRLAAGRTIILVSHDASEATLLGCEKTFRL